MRRVFPPHGDWSGGDGLVEGVARDAWLGGEAHVSFRGRSPAWHEALRSRDGFSALAISLAFGAGLLIGGGMALINWSRRRPSRADRRTTG